MFNVLLDMLQLVKPKAPKENKEKRIKTHSIIDSGYNIMISYIQASPKFLEFVFDLAIYLVTLYLKKCYIRAPLRIHFKSKTRPEN